MISVYGHTARAVVTQIGETEMAKEIRSEPTACVIIKYESSRGQNEFFLNDFCPEDGISIFIRIFSVHSVSTMNVALSGRAIPLHPSLCFRDKLLDDVYLYL